MLAAVFNVLRAVLVVTAVASTIAGIVTVRPSQTVAVVGSGVLAATPWNRVFAVPVASTSTSPTRQRADEQGPTSLNKAWKGRRGVFRA